MPRSTTTAPGAARFGEPHPSAPGLVRTGASCLREPRLVSLALLRRWAMPTAVTASPSSAGDPPKRHVALAITTFLLALLATILVVAPSAHAEEVFTSQAAAANATDSTWIPAPPKRAALCIVDTGTDLNPDTSNVIARFSVDGGDPSDLSPDHHGTLMTMIASAPYNGFGMVGAAPSINVVSVRASRDGRSFGGTDLGLAIQRCINLRTAYNIKVVSLSLGGRMLSDLDSAAMANVENYVDNARRNGINVVAAAGNNAGPVEWPAAYRRTFAVGAADVQGRACSFASSGSEVDLWTSGCPLDAVLPDGEAAWASGSSESTAFVAGVITQFRQLKPDLAVDASEQALITNAHRVAEGVALDVAAAYRDAGLEDLLAVGQSARAAIPIRGESGAPPKISPSAAEVGSSTSGSFEASMPGVLPREQPYVGWAVPTRLPRPIARFVRRRDGLLTVAVKNRPTGADLVLEIYGARNGGEFPSLVRKLRVRDDRLQTRGSRILRRLSIAYRDPTGRRRTSPVLSLELRT